MLSNIENIDYISGEKIQALADIDLTKTPLPNKNCSVYIDTYNLAIALRAIEQNSNNKYILITHNSDINISEEHVVKLPSNIVKWFGQNMNTLNSRCVGVPIGIANKEWPHGQIQDIIDLLSETKNLNITHLASLCIKIETSPTVRRQWFNYLSNENWCLVDNWPIDRKTFLRHMRETLFCISPPGNGVDCHRHWEAIFTGRIPVVQDDLWLTHFSELPFVKIKSLEELTPQFLESKLEMYKKKDWNCEKMFMPYWQSKLTESCSWYL